jgi:carbonic anhydrase
MKDLCEPTAARLLLDGYKRFRDNDLLTLQNKMKHLSNEGQDPHAMVLSCCDSRAVRLTTLPIK